MTTPFPFPLVQMARTFLFFYIYTLPFALLNDASKPLAHLCVVFMVSILLGMEYWCWWLVEEEVARLFLVSHIMEMVLSLTKYFVRSFLFST